MKNQFLAITLLSLLVFGACKPRSQELTPHTAINPDLIEQAKTHFENEQSITLSKPIQVSIAERGNRVNLWNYPVFRTFKPIWNKTEQVTLLNGNKVLITPLRRNMKVDYNNLYYIRRLRIELNAQNQIVKTNIVELVTLKHTVASQKYQIIANVFEEIHTRTDAKIMVFDAGYTPQIENSTLWKGEANNNNNANNKGSNGSDTPPVCYYLTAVASCTDVQYLADISTSCDPGDPSGTIYGVGAISNNCQSGGGGSGYIGNPDNPVGGVGTPWGDNGQDQPLDPNYLPPTFSDPEGIYKAYKEALVTDLADTKNQIQNFGTSQIPNLVKMVNYLRIRQEKLEKAISDVARIEASTRSYKFISLAPDANGKPQGETSYDVATNQIVIAFPQSTSGKQGLGLKAHEVHHAVQFLDGKLSFNKTTGKAGVLADLQDEIECYEIQYVLDTNFINYGTVDINLEPAPNFTVNSTTVLALGIYNALPTTEININTNPQGTTLQNAGTNATDIFVKP